MSSSFEQAVFQPFVVCINHLVNKSTENKFDDENVTDFFDKNILPWNNQFDKDVLVPISHGVPICDSNVSGLNSNLPQSGIIDLGKISQDLQFAGDNNGKRLVFPQEKSEFLFNMEIKIGILTGKDDGDSFDQKILKKRPLDEKASQRTNIKKHITSKNNKYEEEQNHNDTENKIFRSSKYDTYRGNRDNWHSDYSSRRDYDHNRQFRDNSDNTYYRDHEENYSNSYSRGPRRGNTRNTYYDNENSDYGNSFNRRFNDDIGPARKTRLLAEEIIASGDRKYRRDQLMSMPLEKIQEIYSKILRNRNLQKSLQKTDERYKIVEEELKKSTAYIKEADAIYKKLSEDSEGYQKWMASRIKLEETIKEQKSLINELLEAKKYLRNQLGISIEEFDSSDNFAFEGEDAFDSGATKSSSTISSTKESKELEAKVSTKEPAESKQFASKVSTDSVASGSKISTASSTLAISTNSTGTGLLKKADQNDIETPEIITSDSSFDKGSTKKSILKASKSENIQRDIPLDKSLTVKRLPDEVLLAKQNKVVSTFGCPWAHCDYRCKGSVDLISHFLLLHVTTRRTDVLCRFHNCEQLISGIDFANHVKSHLCNYLEKSKGFLNLQFNGFNHPEKYIDEVTIFLEVVNSMKTVSTYIIPHITDFSPPFYCEWYDCDQYGVQFNDFKAFSKHMQNHLNDYANNKEMYGKLHYQLKKVYQADAERKRQLAKQSLTQQSSELNSEKLKKQISFLNNQKTTEVRDGEFANEKNRISSSSNASLIDKDTKYTDANKKSLHDVLQSSSDAHRGTIKNTIMSNEQSSKFNKNKRKREYKKLPEKFREFPCEWKNCEAILHNVETFVRHFDQVHKNDIKFYVCYFTKCPLKSVKQNSTEFRQHLKDHLKGWANGGLGLRVSDYIFEPSIPPKLSLSERAITPLAKRAPPKYKFPAVIMKSREEKEFLKNLPSRLKPRLEEIRSKGVGWEADPDVLRLANGMSLLKSTHDKNYMTSFIGPGAEIRKSTT